MKIYLIGSLRNPKVPLIGNALREAGFDVFDDWFSPGPEADDKWQEYEKTRGRTYLEALQGAHSRDIFMFDFTHLQQADIAVLVLPAGKSGHLELGWIVGQGKPAYVLFDKEPDRYEIMYQFADMVFMDLESLVEHLRRKYIVKR